MTLHKHTAQAGLAGSTQSLEDEIDYIQPSENIIQPYPSSDDDDDYDNCDAWDDDYASNEDQLVWENLRLSPRNHDSATADSEDESDADSTQDTLASLSMSTDSCLSEDELSDLPHWWGNEDRGTFSYFLFVTPFLKMAKCF